MEGERGGRKDYLMAANTTAGEIMQEETALAHREQAELEERSVDQVRSQVAKIQELMNSVLIDGHHYGITPGTKKPSLYKPGAEQICLTFRLLPKFHITTTELAAGHREKEIICDLYHANTGAWMGQGVGSCSTMESKYRWRKSGRVCPNCGEGTIRRSNYPDKHTGAKGWYCNEKAGGCNGKFSYDDPRIEEQQTERQENPDIADQYNTVLKMAKKRAHVDATITATAASDVFTQDVEDFSEHTTSTEPKKAEPKAKANGNGKKVDEAKATDKQIQKLWATAGDRAEETGTVREQIMRDVLKVLKLEESTHDIPRNKVDDVLNAITQYEPPAPEQSDGTPF
jgi:predicted RNA-binding Zn-ribbon protein involved in translation (DUF1610 family)